MAEEKQQEGQKTLVAFIVGLLVGGMLVWAFSGPEATAPVEDDEKSIEETTSTTDEETNTTDDVTGTTNQVETPAPSLNVGDGSVVVRNQKAGTSIALESATYPVSEGWIGVREYNNDQLGFILGVVRFSESQELVPSEIILQRPTTPGNRYAVVIFTEDGDLTFNLAGDVQIDEIFATFVAQ